MKAYGLDGLPYAHPKMDEWRDSLHRGITYPFPATDLVITGGVDDLWVNPAGELIVVDYKATAKNSEVSLDADWQIGYKRQMEIYQWLFRKNGFKVSATGYFVYCNGRTSQESFDGKLEFDIKVIPYVGSSDWVDTAIEDISDCLNSDSLPQSSPECVYCGYLQAARKVEPVE